VVDYVVVESGMLCITFMGTACNQNESDNGFCPDACFSLQGTATLDQLMGQKAI
jgi:hypothetical protein